MLIPSPPKKIRKGTKVSCSCPPDCCNSDHKSHKARMTVARKKKPKKR